MEPDLGSDEWLEALGRRLAATGPVPAGTAICLCQVVTDRPEGKDASWTILLQPGEVPRVERSGPEEADITILTSYQSLGELAAGDKTAAELLAAGEMKLRGDARQLLRAAGLIEATTAAVAAARG